MGQAQTVYVRRARVATVGELPPVRAAQTAFNFHAGELHSFLNIAQECRMSGRKNRGVYEAEAEGPYAGRPGDGNQEQRGGLGAYSFGRDRGKPGNHEEQRKVEQSRHARSKG